MLGRFCRYLEKVFNFSLSLQQLKDHRHHPSISTKTVFYCVFLLFALRLGSLNAFEEHYRSKSRYHLWKKSLGESPPSADTIGYAFKHFDCDTLRGLLHNIYTKLQRNHIINHIRLKGFSVCAIDGYELFSSYTRCCNQCCTRRIHTSQGERIQYYHRVTIAQLLGGSLAILLDAEPIHPGEDEVAAGMRLIERLIKNYPKAFDVVTADGLYARAGFINLLIKHSKQALFVLKENNSNLLEDARGLFSTIEPVTKREGLMEYQRWDEEGFSHWDDVKIPIRIVRSLEIKHNGKHIQSSDWYWGSTLPKAIVSTESICKIGHMRWEIENQGFNVLANYYSLDHCFKHNPNAILAFILVCFMAYVLFQVFYYRNLKITLSHRCSLQHIAIQLIESLNEILQNSTILFPPALKPG